MNGLNERDIGNAISSLILNLLSREVHTAMPGKVEKVETLNGHPTVDVQPLLKMALPDGTQKKFQVVPGVMLLNVGTSVSSVIMPVKKDDLVLLVYSERSLDKWKMDGTVADTFFGQQFDMSDAFAIPFNFSSLNIATTNDDLIVMHEGQKITIKANGDIEVGTGTLKALITSDYMSHTHTFAGTAVVDPGTHAGTCAGTTNASADITSKTSKVKAI
jgi:hypothetical protein